jgi:hypothetical protein
MEGKILCQKNVFFLEEKERPTEVPFLRKKITFFWQRLE